MKDKNDTEGQYPKSLKLKLLSGWQQLSSFISPLLIQRRISSFICQLLTLLLLSSCSEILYINIEQMLPPEIMPKHRAKSIGVVSNFSRNNVIIVDENSIILPFDADTIKEQVALTLADAGFMDRVVMLDSLLYHPDSTAPHILSQNEINRLCQELEVEMIYSIDYACLTFNPVSQFTARPLNAYLCARIYTPCCDSITGANILEKKVLDYWINDTKEISYLIPQIPQQLAEAAIKPYLPSWKERERVFYYDRLSYELRESKVYVHENNWAAAAEQWRMLLNSRWQPYRFMAAYNLALYHEMTDEIDQAITYLDLAEETATTQIIDTSLVKEYREVLLNRKKELKQLEQCHQSTRR